MATGRCRNVSRSTSTSPRACATSTEKSTWATTRDGSRNAVAVTYQNGNPIFKFQDKTNAPKTWNAARSAGDTVTLQDALFEEIANNQGQFVLEPTSAPQFRKNGVPQGNLWKIQ